MVSLLAALPRAAMGMLSTNSDTISDDSLLSSSLSSSSSSTASSSSPSPFGSEVVGDASTLLRMTETERIVRRCTRIRIVPCVYLKCPPERQRDERFALAALVGLDRYTHRRMQVIQSVARHCPSILSNAVALQEIVQHSDVHGLEDLLAALSRRMTWTLELALMALRRNMALYRWLPNEWQTHGDVLQTILAGPGASAKYIGRHAPQSFLVTHPDLVLQCLPRGFGRENVPQTLLQCKEFVLSAIPVDPLILMHCSMDMIMDRDILLEVCSLESWPNKNSNNNNSNDMALLKQLYLDRPCWQHDVVLPLAEHVKSQLENYAAYQVFLQGITLNLQGPLPLLQCGEETSVGLKRCIAEFVGIPTTRTRIEKLQRAWDNVLSDLLLSARQGLVVVCEEDREVYDDYDYNDENHHHHHYFHQHSVTTRCAFSTSKMLEHQWVHEPCQRRRRDGDELSQLNSVHSGTLPLEWGRVDDDHDDWFSRTSTSSSTDSGSDTDDDDDDDDNNSGELFYFPLDQFDE